MSHPERPTDAELDILRVLWQDGAKTVREVHDHLGGNKSYTTTLKQLQVMFEKGYVTRDSSQRSHVYSAAIGESETQTNLLEHLLTHAFGGSRSKLFLRALEQSKTSEGDLKEVRELLERLEGEA